jgi:hypothetical protein
MRQTSIEWLVEQITVKEPSGQYLIDVMSEQELEDIFTKAFDMHIQEIADGVEYGFEEGCSFSISGKTETKNAKEYYDKTYGGKL